MGWWVRERKNQRSWEDYLVSQGRCYACLRVGEGTMVEGKVNGWAVATQINGDRYEGEWVDNQMTGKGKLYYADGSIYEGEWSNNERHGKGQYLDSLGNRFDGYFKNDIAIEGTCHLIDDSKADCFQLIDGDWVINR